jgi:hypothetical protein
LTVICRGVFRILSVEKTIMRVLKHNIFTKNRTFNAMIKTVLMLNLAPKYIVGTQPSAMWLEADEFKLFQYKTLKRQTYYWTPVEKHYIQQQLYM